MAAVEHANGIESLDKVMSAEKYADKHIFVLFSGATDAAGNSWCSDCVAADPVINQLTAKYLGAESVLVHCSVGDRPTWKDPNNPFRTSAKWKLSSVPTLIHCKSGKRLEEAQCANAGLVSMLFETVLED